MYRLIVLMVTGVMVFTSCITPDGTPAEVPKGAKVYVPIYASKDEAQTLSVGPAKQVNRPGKIIVYNDYLLINVPGEGFHVVDNTNPQLPRPKYFVNVPGSNDLAIRNGVLFADNYADIVAFSITSADSISIIKRMDNVMNNNGYPPFPNVYFECPDPTKGVVIGWEESNIRNVRCYRP